MRHQHRLAFPLKPRRPRQAGPRHTGSPQGRPLLATVLVLLAIALFFIWRVLQQGPVMLPVINQGSEAVMLRFHGDGLLQPVEVAALLPLERVEVELVLAREGGLRLSSQSASASVDSLLLARANALREGEMQLEIQQGNRFVLVPRG